MNIFKSEFTLLLYYLITTVCVLGIQMLLCFKAKHKSIKRIPAYLLAIAWGYVLLMAAGVFGTGGGGWLGNMHLLEAAILSIIFLAPTIGVAIAWIVYFFQNRKTR